MNSSRKSQPAPSAVGEANAEPDTGSSPTLQQTAEYSSSASREEQIRLAAYASAERRGFAPGFETDDWLEAERRFEEGPAAQ